MHKICDYVVSQAMNWQTRSNQDFAYLGFFISSFSILHFSLNTFYKNHLQALNSLDATLIIKLKPALACPNFDTISPPIFTSDNEV